VLERAVGPNVSLSDVADDPAAHEFDGPAQPAMRGALVAHLRDHAGLGRGLAHQAALCRRVRQRLLAVDMLAGADRQQRRQGMMMIGRRDGDGIDLLADLVEELAVVVELPGLWPGCGAFAKPVLVDVAQRDDLHQRPGLLDVAGALAPDADARDAEPTVR